MILELLIRHGLKPLCIAILVILLVSFSPFSSDPEYGAADGEGENDDENYLQDLTNLTTLTPSNTSSEQNLTGFLETIEVEKNQTEFATNSSSAAEDKSSLFETWGLRTKLAETVPVTSISSSNHQDVIDFMKWALAFIPRPWTRVPARDRFLRAAGVLSHSVCSVPPDPLDYSIGWQQRSMLYLYQSNKTRVQCSFEQPDDPHLQIINGHLLNGYLAATVGTKMCTAVFFFSSTCPYSRRAAPLMHSAAIYFPTLRFLAIDTDVAPGVAGHYGIMGVPVIVLFQEKKFLTGWTIPFPDARDTIRTFIMAYTDAKYIPKTQNISGLEEGILSHFTLEKHNDILYMLAYIIVLSSFVLTFWKKYLLKLLKRSLEQSGVNGEGFVMGAIQQPQVNLGPDIPVPVMDIGPQIH